MRVGTRSIALAMAGALLGIVFIAWIKDASQEASTLEIDVIEDQSHERTLSSTDNLEVDSHNGHELSSSTPGNVMLELGDPANGRSNTEIPSLAGRILAPSPMATTETRAIWVSGRFRESKHDLVSWIERFDEISAASYQSNVLPDGSFVFDENHQPQDRAQSWLFLLCEGYETTAIEVGEEKSLGSIRVQRCDPLPIRLIGDLSRSTRLVVRIVSLQTVVRSDQPDWQECGEVLTFQEVTTSELGLTSCSRSRGEMLAVAYSSDSLSSPWIGDGMSTSEIVLTLHPRLRVSGTVTRAQGVSQELHISVSHSTNQSQRPLVFLREDTSGVFGPVFIPRLEEGIYTLRLEGIGVVPVQQRFSGPIYADEIRAEFEARLGPGFRILVLNQEDEPIGDAQVVVSWKDNDDTCTLSKRTDVSGATLIDAVKEGEVWVDLSAEGYSPNRAGPYRVPETLHSSQDLVLRLSPAGRLQVRCMYRSELVSEFTVRYWTGQPWNIIERRVNKNDGGVCHLEDVPLGDIQIFCIARDLGHSDTRTVNVQRGTEEEIIFEFGEPARAIGRVLDGITRDPLPSATVQVFAMHGAQRVGISSDPRPVDSNGELVDVLVSRGWNQVEFRAEGYSSDTRTGQPDVTGTFDCGEVLLRRGNDLTVCLVGTIGSDWSSYRVELVGAKDYPSVGCDVHGIARFHEVEPGPTTIAIYPPGGGRQDIYVLLEPGANWHFSVPFEVDRRLTVEVQPQAGESIATGTYMGVTFLTSEGWRSLRYLEVGQNGIVEVANVCGERAVLDVLGPGPDFKRLCVEEILLQPGENRVQLELKARGRSLRFVDSSGTSLSGVSVEIMLAGSTVSWIAHHVTDSSGEMVVQGVGNRSLTANILMEEATAMAIPIPDARDGAKSTTVVVDLGGAFRLRMLDGDQPLENLDVFIASVQGFPPSLHIRSEADGRIVAEHITPRSYHVWVAGEHIWRTEFEAVARQDAPERIIQVRRVGSLDVSVARDGYPVAGAAIELWSNEFGEAMSDWIAAGRVRASSATPLTDGGGRLTLSGLPRGAYRWLVRCADGTERAGEVEVPVGETGNLTVDVGH